MHKIKLKKGKIYKADPKNEFSPEMIKIRWEMRAEAAKMIKKHDREQRAAYYAIQEIRKKEALKYLP